MQAAERAHLRLKNQQSWPSKESSRFVAGKAPQDVAPIPSMPTVVCNFNTNRNQNGDENVIRCNFNEYSSFTNASTLAVSLVLQWYNRGYTTPIRGITVVIPLLAVV
jgi:hypothetical protein